MQYLIWIKFTESELNLNTKEKYFVGLREYIAINFTLLQAQLGGY